MIEFLTVIFFLWLLFRITGLLFHIAGRIIGLLLSITGYLILGILAAGLFGIAVYVLPVILLAGAGTVIYRLKA